MAPPAVPDAAVVRGVKGNGSTLMVACEAHGIPVACHLAQSSTHEFQPARATLAEVRVPQVGRGRPKTRILEPAMDRAYARELRRDLRRRGIRPSIPERKRRGKRRQRGPKPKQYPVSKERYKVERLDAWMAMYRALVVRMNAPQGIALPTAFLLASPCACGESLRLRPAGPTVWWSHQVCVQHGAQA